MIRYFSNEDTKTDLNMNTTAIVGMVGRVRELSFADMG